MTRVYRTFTRNRSRRRPPAEGQQETKDELSKTDELKQTSDKFLQLLTEEHIDRRRHRPMKEIKVNDTVDKAAFSVTEFCKMHGFSKSEYYNLRKRGQGPEELRIGTRVLVTVESAADWRRRLTAETSRMLAEVSPGERRKRKGAA